MTSRAILAALVVAAFVAGRATATPRSAATVIPADAWRSIEASHDGRRSSVEQSAGQPEVAGAEPVAGLVDASSPVAVIVADESQPVASPSAATSPGRSANRVLIATGLASWYCKPGVSACTRGYPASGLYAAAGSALRAAIGRNWRGTVVVVTANGFAVRAQLVDWCSCPGGRILDLYSSVVTALGLPLSRGVYTVRVTWP